MDNKTKYKLKCAGVSTLALVLLFSSLSYASAPSSDNFIESINPFTAFSGLVFTLNYLGLSTVMSVIILILLSILIWFLLLLLVKRIIK